VRSDVTVNDGDTGWGYGIARRISMRIAMVGDEKMGGAGGLRPFTPSSGGIVGGLFSAFHALLEPIQNLLFHPPHPAFAKPHPFRELPGRFQAGDVLGRIED
jgi:hypothetical protein